ncbi:MAG TPA: hypothetical protein VJ203_01530 [Bacteroidales bacterium]|nr:hypothetical protein [Bacteroidales bacterium]
MGIRYLKNSEIDVNAWDKCISESFNGNIYALSWFLDLICDTWDALVEDDYLSVMPLITRRYLGRDIIYDHGFAGELGIFSRTPINVDKTALFIMAIPNRFRYYRIVLNKYNPLDEKETPHTSKRRFELDLIKPYYKLAGDFDPGIRQKLNLATARGMSFIKGLSPNDMIMFIIEKNIPVDKNIRINNYRLLRTIMAGLIRYNSGEICGVYNQHNDLASAGLFAFAKNNINLLFQVTSPEQNQDFPHLFLIDRFIEKYAETNTTLSFGIPVNPAATLPFAGFGARESTIAVITRNDLPFYIRCFRLSRDL